MRALSDRRVESRRRSMTGGRLSSAGALELEVGAWPGCRCARARQVAGASEHRGLHPWKWVSPNSWSPSRSCPAFSASALALQMPERERGYRVQILLEQTQVPTYRRGRRNIQFVSKQVQLSACRVQCRFNRVLMPWSGCLNCLFHIFELLIWLYRVWN